MVLSTTYNVDVWMFLMNTIFSKKKKLLHSSKEDFRETTADNRWEWDLADHTPQLKDEQYIPYGCWFVKGWHFIFQSLQIFCRYAWSFSRVWPHSTFIHLVRKGQSRKTRFRNINPCKKIYIMILCTQQQNALLIGVHYRCSRQCKD